MPTLRSAPRTVGASWHRLWREAAGVVQPLRLVVRLPGLLRGPRGSGEPVVVLPGRGFGDRSTMLLCRYLRHLGYDARGWGLGLNVRHAHETVPEVIADLDDRLDRPAALVGQSLGGYVAREVARARPDMVRQVITLGSPIFGGLTHGPIVRPVTAVFSRRDGVVPVHRALDGERATTLVEVRSTHFAMGIDPDVWSVVAARLAAGD